MRVRILVKEEGVDISIFGPTGIEFWGKYFKATAPGDTANILKEVIEGMESPMTGRIEVEIGV